MKRPIVHSDALAERIRSGYSLDETTMLRSFLVERGTGAIEAPSFGDPNGHGVVGSFQRRGLRSSSLWKSPLPDRMRRKHLSERRDVVPGAEVEHRGQSARAADR
jgi:hypothetical protein